LLADLAGELPGRLGGLREHLRTLLAVSVPVLTALLGARLGGLRERLEGGGRELRLPGRQREGRLPEFDDVFATADAADHHRVGLLDALLGAPPADLHGPRDGLDGLPLLRRLDVLEGHVRSTARLLATHRLTAHLLTATHRLTAAHLLSRSACLPHLLAHE
jgi:hypothetical protein